MQSSHARTSLPPHRSSTNQQEEHAEQSHAPLSSTKPTTTASCRAGPRRDLALPPGTLRCCPSLQPHLSPRLRLPGHLGAHTASMPPSYLRRDRMDSLTPHRAALTRFYCELPVPPADDAHLPATSPFLPPPPSLPPQLAVRPPPSISLHKLSQHEVRTGMSCPRPPLSAPPPHSRPPPCPRRPPATTVSLPLCAPPLFLSASRGRRWTFCP
jgi:hypothetical protein